MGIQASVETSLFWVRLEFPESSLASIPEVAVARLSLPPSLGLFHGIVGRDLLRRWDSFLFEGRRGRFILRDTPAGLEPGFVASASPPTSNKGGQGGASRPLRTAGPQPC